MLVTGNVGLGGCLEVDWGICMIARQTRTCYMGPGLLCVDWEGYMYEEGQGDTMAIPLEKKVGNVARWIN